MTSSFGGAGHPIPGYSGNHQSWSTSAPQPPSIPEYDSVSQQNPHSQQYSQQPWGTEEVELGRFNPGQQPHNPFDDSNLAAGPYQHGGQHRGYEALRDPSTPSLHKQAFLPPGFSVSGPPSPSVVKLRAEEQPGFSRIRRSRWVMYICLILGVACAVGHHVFYSTLNGKPATDQLVMQRYGTLLAFGAKAGISASVVIAHHQRVWVTVRKRILSIGALDSLFSATENLFSLFRWEMIKNAKIATLLAVFVWIAPLVVILTANTLQVELGRVVTMDRCPGIRTLNFALEETDEWRDPTWIGKYTEIPAVIWNTTKRSGDSDDDGDWFDYYTAPGPILDQTTTVGAFMGETIMRKNAQLETCGGGWNCTFQIEIASGPAYKCTELASGVGVKASNLTQESGSIAPPFSTDVLVPRGFHTYYAFATGGEYFHMQMNDVSAGGVPKTPRPDPKNLGAFRTEPIIWIGFAARADPSKPLPETSNSPDWDKAFIPRLFACENYEASYKVTFNYTEGFHTTAVTDVKYLRPVINTTYLPNVNSQDGTADNTTATPESNYVFPKDKAKYRRTAAYHALSQLARRFVNGTMQINSRDANGVPLVNTNAIQTKLLDASNNYLPHENLMEYIQRFYLEDIILSMLSNPQFASVTWAAKPDQQSGLLGGKESFQDLAKDDSLKYPCERSRVTNLYNYHARDLWIVYGISILLGIIAVVVGAFAVEENGGNATRDTSFSSIVAATRSKDLNKVSWDGGGDSGAAARVPSSVREMRMGYGIVPVDSARGLTTGYKEEDLKYGFAFEGDLRRIKRVDNAVKRLTSATFSSSLRDLRSEGSTLCDHGCDESILVGIGELSQSRRKMGGDRPDAIVCYNISVRLMTRQGWVWNSLFKVRLCVSLSLLPQSSSKHGKFWQDVDGELSVESGSADLWRKATKDTSSASAEALILT
ncbi:hypothetical protein QBC35DRAFT_473873 [Podospora australis]|uniref:Uncharacterized protein n=1 Tax=Podospora australis TaxID=1536484 RepID=A0AAN6WTY0_9PEZI|nr:hypothetical protein QBC35DRAFT_473873 [Podospora australis]